MSNYRSIIDEAMKTAKYRLGAGVDKTASAPTDNGIVKEASELANALEYMAISSANDGTTAGSARAELVRDFFKTATSERLGTKLAGTVGEGSTQTKGTQGQAPVSGKTKLHKRLDKNGQPLVTSSPSSKGNALLESYKQAEGEQSLYDILMNKNAAGGGPAELEANEAAPGVPSNNENSNRSILNSEASIVNATRQEAKAPVRQRLAEAFAATSDTTGDSSARSIFPQAHQGGGLKKVARKRMTEREYLDAKETAQLAGGAGFGLGGLAGLGIAGPVAAGVTAPEGQRLRTGIYSTLGGLGGATLGAIPGVAHRNMGGALLGALGGGTLGAGYGAGAAIRKEASSVRSRLIKMAE